MNSCTCIAPTSHLRVDVCLDRPCNRREVIARPLTAAYEQRSAAQAEGHAQEASRGLITPRAPTPEPARPPAALELDAAGTKRPRQRRQSGLEVVAAPQRAEHG